MTSDQSNTISLINLHKVGAHRGGKKSSLNPKLKPFVYGYNNGLCLIDLTKSSDSLKQVEDLARKLGTKKRQILLVSTSKHLKKIVSDYANQFSTGVMPFVNSRWLGGSLTNWLTIKKTLKLLDNLTKIIDNEEFYKKLTKNEQLNTVRKRDKIFKFFEGLVHLRHSSPGAIIVLNSNDDPIAIAEAEKKGIPVISFSSTSTKHLPKSLDHHIVTNVYSVNAIKLFMNRIISAYNEGVQIGVAQQQSSTEDKKSPHKVNS